MAENFIFAGVLSYNTVWRKKRYECTFGYNFKSFQGWLKNVYPNESLGSPLSEKHIWIWLIPSYLKEPPCTLSIPSSCRCSQWKQHNSVKKKIIDMNVRLSITLDVFKEGRQINISIKAYVLPFQNNISFLNLAIYLKEPPCALSIPSSCWCSQ